MKIRLYSVTKMTRDWADKVEKEDGSVTFTCSRVPASEFEIYLLPRIKIWREYRSVNGIPRDTKKYLASWAISIYFLLWRVDIASKCKIKD